MDVTFYTCLHCGNVAIKAFDGGAPLMCCGEVMRELKANSTEAAVEKHVPVVSVKGSQVTVQVGEVEHPMTDEHKIALVCLVTEKGYQMAPLTATDKPEAQFCVAEGDKALRVYEYCNLHGLWAADIAEA